MRNDALLDKVVVTAIAYYAELRRNRFNVVSNEPPRKYKTALKNAENEAFADGFSEVEIEYAKRRGETIAKKGVTK